MCRTLDMPLTGAQRTEAETAYHGSLALIESTVKAFVAKYGGEFAELRADADSIFMGAYNTYEKGVVWNTHLRRWIWFILLDALRVKLRRWHKAPMEGGDATASAYMTDAWQADPCANLGEDANVILRLIFDAPEIEGHVAKEGGNPANWRSILRQHLRQVGWTRRRVCESFSEISRAIS